MRQYTDTKKLNQDLLLTEKYFVNHDDLRYRNSIVGTKYEPFFDRNQQKFIDSWVITIDGWPQ